MIWYKVEEATPMLHVNDSMDDNKTPEEMFLVSDLCVCAMDNGDFGIGTFNVEYTDGKLSQGWDIHTYYNGIRSDPVSWAKIDYEEENK